MIGRAGPSPYYVTSAYKHAAEKLCGTMDRWECPLADVPNTQEWVVAVQGIIDRHRNHREPGNALLLEAVRQGLSAPRTLEVSRGLQPPTHWEHNAHLLKVMITGERGVSFSSRLEHYPGQMNDTYYRRLETRITSADPSIEGWDDSWVSRPRLGHPSTHINEVAGMEEGDYGYERMKVITNVLGATTILMNGIGLVLEQK